MKIIFFIMIFLFSSNVYASKVICKLNSIRSNLVDVITDESSGYKKESVSWKLRKIGSQYVFNKIPLIKIIDNDQTNFIRLAEITFLGDVVYYTYNKHNKILTIQKSYDMNGHIMVNIYGKCI